MGKRLTNRVIALLLVMPLVFTQIPVTAMPVYAQGSGCTHQHDESCAYTKGTECTHVCGGSLGDYIDGVLCDHDCEAAGCADPCGHSHDDGTCAYVAGTEWDYEFYATGSDASPSDAYDAGAECDHAHDGKCGYIKAVPCDHEHNADCGWLSGQQKPEGESGTVIASFAAPAQSATVVLGTSRADLLLPETVAATLTDAATPTDIPVEWTDEDGYDGDISGNYDFTAVPQGYSLADGVSAPVFTVTVADTAALRTVTAFGSLPEDIRFQRGYEPNLPDTVEGTVDGVTAQIPVTWQSEEYDSLGMAGGLAVFTAISCEGYIPADGVGAPTIAFMRETMLRMGGAGTQGNPLQITSAAQLAEIAALVNAGSLEQTVLSDSTGTGTVYLKLINDIDLSAYDTGAGWTPIGISTSSPFKGQFNGGGNTVTGLYINRTASYAGLFGYVASNAVVQNLGVVNANVTGRSYVGGVVGYVPGNGTVENCYVTGSVSGNNGIGGVAGWVSGGTVENCYTTASVTGTSEYIGGVAGFVGNNSTMKNCYATGSVTGTGNYNYVGGVAGKVGGTVENCYATGSVSGAGNYVGGVAGVVDGTIKNCYATGSVGGVGYVGGVTGSVTGTGTGAVHIQSCAALNPIVYGLSNVGRVSGSKGSKSTNNYAYIGMECESKTSSIYTLYDDGTPISAAEIAADGTLSGLFVNNNNPWTTVPGSLPGLFGDAVTMPVHLREDGAHPFDGGDGTEFNAYQISTAAQLAWLAEQVNAGDAAYNSACYKLTSHIDLSAYGNDWNDSKGWIPIGCSYSYPFKGQFDGDNHTVSGLYINKSLINHAGLFGYVYNGAVVQNLGVVNANVTGDANVGSVVGTVIGMVENCYATGSIDGNGTVGGMVGYVDAAGTVKNCYATSSVNGEYNVGGVAGTVIGMVQNCYATGSVGGDYCVGGVVGFVDNGTVENCYATGSVIGNSCVGGVVGDAHYFGTLKNCAALNPLVFGTSDVGRVIGYGTGQDTNYAYSDMLCESNGSGVSGTPITAADIADGTKLSALFNAADGWTTATGMLPGLFGAAVPLPEHLRDGITHPFDGGSGTVSAPYEISTAAQLAWLAGQVNAGTAPYAKGNVYYKLTADIDLSAYGKNWNNGAGWIPIGTSTSSNYFNGQFDGNGKTISGLYINRTDDNTGLFGYVCNGAAVKNLGVVNADVSGTNQVGSVAGYVVGVGSTVQNCYATGSVSGTGNYVGGVVGSVITGPVQNCYATSSISGNAHVGGVVGRVQNTTVQNCYATGSVTATGTGYIGGVVGSIQSSTVQNCAALNPSVSGSNHVGRVIGSGTGTNNYAYSGMDCTNKGGDDGETMTAADAHSASFWTTGDNWNGGSGPGWDELVWTITNDRLPVLKNVGGEQSGGSGMYLTVKTIEYATIGGSFTYNGSFIWPTVTLGGVILTGGTDYTVTGTSGTSNGTNAGTAEVTITGKGNYTGTKTGSYTINKADQAAPAAPTLNTKDAESITLNTISGAQYKISTGTWQTSAEFTGLTPNTGYTFYACYPAGANYNASPESAVSATITTNKAALEGTVSINNTTPEYLDTLTADTGDLAANPGGDMGTLTYQWNRGGVAIDDATGSTYIVQSVDIGKTITVTVTAGNCQSPVTSDATSAVAKRTPVEGDLTYSLTAVDYNGSVRSLSVAAKTGVTGLGTITPEYNDGTTAPTDAGSYTVVAFITEGVNYAGAEIALGTFTINKIAPTADLLDYDLTTVNYDTNRHSVSVTAKSGAQGLGTITVKYNDSEIAPANAGVYTITVSIAAGLNYLAASADFTLGTFTISGSDIDEDDIEVTAFSGTYDGTGHSISVVDMVGGGTVTYCATQNGTYTGSSPAYTDAGTYTIYFQVMRTGSNYNVYSGRGTVTINKAALTITAAAISAKTYDETTDATVTGVTLAGSVGNLMLGTDFNATAAFDNADAGTGKTVTVTVTLGNTALANNHSLSITTYELTGQSIAPATGSFGSPDAIDTTYTTTLTLADLTLPTGYAWTTPTTTLDVSNSGQSFAATYTDPNGNHTAASGSITVNVAKAGQTAPSAPTLDTSDATSITLNTTSGAEYSKDGTTWQDSETFTGLDPDTGYTFHARLKETSNYNASPNSPASATITTDKAALGGTVTISGTTQYGETLTAVTTGLNSTPSVALGVLSYQWKRDVTEISGATNSTYILQSADIGQTITVTVTAANCTGSLDSASTGEIGKATPDALIWPTAATITYGAELSTSALSGGSTTGTFAWTDGTTIPTVTNSGCSVTFTPADMDNYDWSSVTLTGTVLITVNKATPATINWPAAATITYGAELSTSALSGGSTTGTFAWTNDATIPTVINSGYEVTFTPTDTANYDWTGVTLTGTVSISVSPKAITITPTAGQSKTFGENDPTFAYTPSEPLVTGNAFTGALSREAGENAGTYAYTMGTLDAGSNYTLSLAAETFEITKAAANAVDTSKSVLYTDTAAQTVDIAALVSNQKLAGDTLSYSAGTVTGTDSGVITSPAMANGTLSFTITGGAAGNTATIPVTVSGFTNYNDITVNVNVTLADKTGVTISGITANQSLAYNGAAKAVVKTNANAGAADVSGLSYSYEGTGTTAYGPSATAPTNAGDYKCTVTLADAAYSADDFVINFTITKATITITADNKAALTGGAEPSYTYTISGLVSGETLAALPTVACPTANRNEAGTYPITAYGAAAPAGGNYDDIVYVNGTLTVTNLPTHTVTFDLAGGTHKGGGELSQTVASGGAAAAPTTTKSGYTFTGWDKAFTNVTADMTVTAQWSYNGGGSGGGGGGGSSSSSSTTTPVTTGKQPDMPTVARVSVTGAVNDHVLTASIITEKMARDAIAAAGSSTNGIAVQFNITGSGDYAGLSVTFERAALEALKTAGVKYMQIGSNVIDLTLDTQAITAILAQTTGDITVTATPPTTLSDAAKALIGSRPVFDITMKDANGATVSDLKGGTVTIGIPYTPASGEKTGSLYGVYVDGSGRPQLLTSSSYDNGKVIFGRSSLSIYGVGYHTAAPAFTDIADHWAKDNIDFVASRGLISGTSTTTFSPDTAITRADFLVALGRLSGMDVGGYTASTFADVPNANPAMPYIQWAVENGIAQSIGDNKFGPDQQITREQMAVMMVNYAKAAGYTLPIVRQAVTFADDAKISSWAKDAVKAIQQTGVISSKQNNLFDPQGSTMRAEASTILRRFVELVIDEGTARGWVQNDAGQWQYINTNGKAVTGWLEPTNGSWYWFDNEGIMAAGKWVQISGKWYYFYAEGKLAVNTTIDGYEVGADGAMKE